MSIGDRYDRSEADRDALDRATFVVPIGASKGLPLILSGAQRNIHPPGFKEATIASS
jgi:hypothetical protein